MSEKEDNNKIYSLPKPYAEKIRDESYDVLSRIQSLLDYELDKEILNLHAITLLCDGHSSNYKIFKDLDFFLENSLVKNDDGQYAVVLPPEHMMFIEQAALAKYFISRSLCEECNISLFLH